MKMEKQNYSREDFYKSNQHRRQSSVGVERQFREGNREEHHHSFSPLISEIIDDFETNNVLKSTNRSKSDPSEEQKHHGKAR
jgi:hypothetical protein